jgi:hypothetical protein
MSAAVKAASLALSAIIRSTTYHQPHQKRRFRGRLRRH